LQESRHQQAQAEKSLQEALERYDVAHSNFVKEQQRRNNAEEALHAYAKEADSRVATARDEAAALLDVVDAAKQDAKAARTALGAALAHARAEASEAATKAELETQAAVEKAKRDSHFAMEVLLQQQQAKAESTEAILEANAHASESLVAQLQQNLQVSNRDRAAENKLKDELRLEVREFVLRRPSILAFTSALVCLTVTHCLVGRSSSSHRQA